MKTDGAQQRSRGDVWLGEELERPLPLLNLAATPPFDPEGICLDLTVSLRSRDAFEGELIGN